MTQFVYVKPHSRNGLVSLSDAKKIADGLKRGSLAVLPTETGYMLAALATSIDALERAFAVKNRATANVMHVACASLEMAGTIGVITPRASRLLGEFTPGPVTVIVEKTDLLPDRLVTLDGTVGIRVPDHPATLQVVHEVGAPVTATSLNSSGSWLPSVGEDDLRSLNWPENEVVHVLADDRAVGYDSASTLVRVTGASAEILRAGPVTEAEIRRVADSAGRLEAADRSSL